MFVVDYHTDNRKLVKAGTELVVSYTMDVRGGGHVYKNETVSGLIAAQRKMWNTLKRNPYSAVIVSVANTGDWLHMGNGHYTPVVMVAGRAD